MKRARFTEEKIIGVLRADEGGAKTADLGRPQLKDENTKLKKLLAEGDARCVDAARAFVNKWYGRRQARGRRAFAAVMGRRNGGPAPSSMRMVFFRAWQAHAEWLLQESQAACATSFSTRA
jgi:hypothetical protein